MYLNKMKQGTSVASIACLCRMNQRSAILMGVVRQQEKRSAGSSGFIGSVWLRAHAASWMQFWCETGFGGGAACGASTCGASEGRVISLLEKKG